jgi:hypothetical protein
MNCPSYVSPFGATGTTNHNGPDALCLSRSHFVHPDHDTIAEFYTAALAAIEHQAPQPAFFLARQLAELALKALHGPHHARTHSLTGLLEALQLQGDDLVAGGPEQNLVVAFIQDLDHIDAVGDQGRYPTTRDGAPSLATVCCADPALLREHVDRLFRYTHARLTAATTLAG